MSVTDDPRQAVLDLQTRLAGSVLGQAHMIERLLLGLLADGHLLVEGLPGLAKTRAIKSLAANLDAGLSRIQFTPDLLPADITGSDIYVSDAGKGEFRFQPGPVFTNLVLADEVNRSPAKVQSALLEAMEERQVTVGGRTHKLPPLFLVMATQNPIEQEGTYALPEAQMDRFLMHVSVGYPDPSVEGDILRLVRAESGAQASGQPAQKLDPAVIFAARAAIHDIQVSEPVERYIIALTQATRPQAQDEQDSQDNLATSEAGRWIQVGVSPRGAIGLDKVSRARAWLQGRDYVTPEDVQAVVHDVFRHRLLLSYEAHAAAVSADSVIDALLQRVAVA
jgi:MoxR-like ATPase